MLEAKRVCAIAEAGGLIVTGQSSAAELGPRNALFLRLITSERAFKGINDSSTHHLTRDVIKGEFKTVEGTLTVPEGPGLGVEIDEEKLKSTTRSTTPASTSTSPASAERVHTSGIEGLKTNFAGARATYIVSDRTSYKPR